MSKSQNFNSFSKNWIFALGDVNLRVRVSVLGVPVDDVQHFFFQNFWRWNTRDSGARTKPVFGKICKKRMKYTLGVFHKWRHTNKDTVVESLAPSPKAVASFSRAASD